MRTTRTLIAILLAFAGVAQAAYADDRPNILFIVSEDNSEQIGCYGEKRVHTPHLDSLAASGVRYERAYVPYSVCSPSRAAFLTGLYTRQNGHIGLATHRFAFYKDFKTMPAYLQEVGYYTGFIGKTHVNPERLVEDYIDFRGVAHANFNNTHSIEDYAREARTIFENAAAEEKPFLAIINYSDAHRKFIGTSKAGYPTVNVEGTEAEPLPWIGVDTPRLRVEMRNYLNCMNRLDEGIGLVLSDLEKLKLRDNTLIIYIADHGGDFPRGKTTCYEGGVKVPMIVNYPKRFPEEKAESSLVSTLDILPTILQEVGVEIPEELMGFPLQRLQDPKSPRRDYIHTFNTGSAAQLTYLTFGICDERYKLIYNPVRSKNLAGISRYANTTIPESLWEPSYIDPPEYELYDLEVDPNEFSNLANLHQFQPVRERMVLAMKAFQLEIGDPFLLRKNIDFYMDEMRDTSRHPKKRSEETWSHLQEFYGDRNQP
ncbi:sulfatase [Verrucomicrobiales bacterium]|nr:sulfatase [Verrucomicrobiales bacterium]